MHHEIKAWEFDGILLETYRYAPGKATLTPPHAHADYQICLSLDFPGQCSYRGTVHPVPQHAFSILHPGETHSTFDPFDREQVSHYRVFYLPPTLFQQALGSEPDKPAAFPYFPDPIRLDDDLFCELLHLHRLLGSYAPRLKQDCALHSLLPRLVQRYAQGSRSQPTLKPDNLLVRRAQAYLEAHFDRNVSLSELAQTVGRHPVYLHQLFQQTLGMPPHVYQTQVRIERAKRLLAQGMAPGHVAQEVGFYDQSHFGRHFRRAVGVTPAAYSP